MSGCFWVFEGSEKNIQGFLEAFRNFQLRIFLSFHVHTFQLNTFKNQVRLLLTTRDVYPKALQIVLDLFVVRAPWSDSRLTPERWSRDPEVIRLKNEICLPLLQLLPVPTIQQSPSSVLTTLQVHICFTLIALLAGSYEIQALKRKCSEEHHWYGGSKERDHMASPLENSSSLYGRLKLTERKEAAHLKCTCVDKGCCFVEEEKVITSTKGIAHLM